MATRPKEADRNFVKTTLASSRLFTDTSDADLEEISRTARTVAFQRTNSLKPPKGAQGEIYLITSGAVAGVLPNEKAVQEKDKDKGILVGLYGSTDVCGLNHAIAANTDKENRKVIFRPLSDVSAIAIPISDFLRVMRRSNELSLSSMAALSYSLDQNQALLASALYDSLEIRLASFFSRLATLIANNNWQPTVDVGKISQTSIAELLGVTREHINRTITMWERSGLVFQTKSNEIIVENRKRLDSLPDLRKGSKKAQYENDWLWEIDAHLDHGLFGEAYDLAMEAAKRAPKDKTFKHRAVIATARSGATHEALQLIDNFKLSADYSDEELACLRPRILRDIAYTKDDLKPAKAPLDLAAKEYIKAFKGSNGTYSGVNAATTLAMLGNLEKAKAIASDVLKIAIKADQDHDRDEIDYWHETTIGECHFIKGELSEAAAYFHRACNTENVTPGKKAQTRRQLLRLCSKLGTSPEWVDEHVPQSSVMFFSGPMAKRATDGTSNQLTGLDSNIELFLDKHDVGVGCGALAAGADIIIAEKLLERGGQLQVYLPLPPKDFLKSSVVPFGGDWQERFIACMKRASIIDWHRSSLPNRAAFQLGAFTAMGMTVRYADEIQANPVGYFAVQEGADKCQTVSHQNAEIWEALGHKAARPAFGASSATKDDQSDCSNEIVFAAIATTSATVKLPAKLERAARINEIDKKSSISIFGFETPEDAMAAATALMAKCGGDVRIWLDVGVFNPGKPGKLTNQFATSSCRPITDPKKLCASEVFANAATALNFRDKSFHYIGFTATDEKLEPCPLYILAE